MNLGGGRESALEACLEAMREVGVDADAALARLPAASEDMADLVRLAADLLALGPLPGPEPAFQARLAAALAVAPEPAALAATGASYRVPTTELVQDLDADLEAMRVEGATAESLLARRPGTAPELAPLLTLAAALAELPRPAVPRDAFRRRLAEHLAAAPAPTSLQRRTSPGSLFARLRRSASVAAALAAAVVVFLGVGAGLASADALPGKPLYPVKRALEQAQLWIMSGEVEMAYHLDLAGRRLAEALAAPTWADSALAEFSGEITAALTYADRALAAGAEPSRLGPPLVARLIGSRGELVAARPRLPPTAWRSSLALLDTAIALWERGGNLAAMPVLRRYGPAGSGRLGAGTGKGAVVRLLPPVAPMPPAILPGQGGGGGGDGDGPVRQGLFVRPPAPGAGSGAVVSAGQATATPERSGSPPGGAGGTTPRPTRVEPRPSDTPRPSPTPSATLGLPVPSPTPTGIAPPTEPPTATTAPSPTPSATPDKLPPVIKGVVQDVLLVPLGGIATFEVDAFDPDGGTLTYHWTASWGEMLEADQSAARFHALGNMSGMGLVVTITVRVTDQTGAWTEGEAHIEVIPRVEGPR